MQDTKYRYYKASPEFRYNDPTAPLMRVTFTCPRGITCTMHREMGESTEEFIHAVFNEYCANWSQEDTDNFRNQFISNI